MKYLAPTDQNIYDAFLDDVIERNKYLGIFCTQLARVKGPTTIGLDGRWGTGKTFFVKQAKLVFDAFNPFIEDEKLEKIRAKAASIIPVELLNNNSMYTVYYDAWENDDETDPLLSLVYSIANSTYSKGALKSNKPVMGLIGQLLDLIPGVQPSGLIEQLTPENFLEKNEKNSTLKKIINDFFDNIPNERGNRVNIFIDELDRCSPKYAVRLLERIKHYFNHERITFIFSLNIQSLEQTIKHYYGRGIEGTRYLDRFFDIRMMLPPISDEKYLQLLDFGSVSAGARIARDMIKKQNMSFREALRYASQYRDACDDTANDLDASIWKMFFLPVAIAFQLTDMTLFRDFMTGNGEQHLCYILENDSVRDQLTRIFKANVRESTIFPDETAWLKECLEQYYLELLQGDYYTSKYKEVNGIEISEQCRMYAYRSVGLFNDR